MKKACIALYIIAAGILIYGYNFCSGEYNIEKSALGYSSKSIDWTPMWFFGIAAVILLIFAVGFTLKIVIRPRISQADRDKVGAKANCRCCNVSLRQDQFRLYKGEVYCNSCYNKVKTTQPDDSAPTPQPAQAPSMPSARTNSKLAEDGITAYYVTYDDKKCSVASFDEYIGLYADASKHSLAIHSFGMVGGAVAKAMAKEKLFQKIYYEEISSISYDPSSITFRFTDGVGDKHTLKFEGDSPVLRKLLAIKPRDLY